MCGIFACICCHNVSNITKKLNDCESVRYLMSRRGPDQCAKCVTNLFDNDLESKQQLFSMSSVLQLRGDLLCDQPLMGLNGNLFQWNGQVFDGIAIEQTDSDTEVLMKMLDNCVRDEELLAVFASVNGPFAFTYWHNTTKRFWFGRDILGRRSLCWNVNRRNEFLLISSVCHSFSGESITWAEIPANGIYCLDVSKYESNQDLSAYLKHYSWDRRISGIRSEHNLNSKLLSPITVPLNRAVPQLENTSRQIPKSTIDEFITVLRESIMKRCCNQQSLCKTCFRTLIENNTDFDMSTLQSSSDSEGDILGPANNFSQTSKQECTHASTAILFSGGLDSTIIALLADDCIPNHLPIDLLNVAFDCDAPDRQTGLTAWSELKTLRPNRRWNFVSIYISKEELQTMREKHIKNLIRPSNTVLDDSIGCAIWFAAYGKGLLLEEGQVTSVYETQARVVLLGMGADEQLAGYTRHRRIFDKSGWAGLIEELALEIDRLSSRNLGRDDRVVSDHGREPRYPFLDEQLINFLNGIPIWHKCDLTLNRSAGEKLLLRKVANRLGLSQTSHHLKRAIQFGSRIAKIEDIKQKGDDLCFRLESQVIV